MGPPIGSEPADVTDGGDHYPALRADRHPRRHRPRRQGARGPAGVRRLRSRDRLALEVPGHGDPRPAARASGRAATSTSAPPTTTAPRSARSSCWPRRGTAPPRRRCRVAAEARRQGRHLHGQRPRPHQRRVPAARPAARLGRRQRAGVRCPGAQVAAAMQHLPAKELGDDRPPDRLRRADLLRPRRGHRVHRRDRAQDPRPAPARRRLAVERHADRGVHRGAARAERPLQDAGRGEAHRHRRRRQRARRRRRRGDS